MHAPAFWARANVEFGVALLEETAALISDTLSGSIPITQGESYAMVFKEALGVVLGMAPWNAPVLLGLRAVVAPLAAGNTVIFKVFPPSLIPTIFVENTKQCRALI